MKTTVAWLKDFVDFDLSPSELCELLNSLGLEVNGASAVGDWGDAVVVGRVAGVRAHPNAERIRLARVDIGAGAPVEVVCGAPNLAEGQKVAFAKPGALLFNPESGRRDFKLKPVKIRGFVSPGMVCSEVELGLGGEHDGILVLDDEPAIGSPLQDIFGDTVLDFDPSPNRPDWFSAIGIAREIAAATGAELRPPATDYPERGEPAERLAAAEIAPSAADLCRRYIAGVVQNIAVKPSPAWMQRRLRAIGERPINNIVDITNYVMFETGQPLHAFDYDKLKARKIVVRRAKAGEKMRTLDGVERRFGGDDLLITDDSHPVAIGGVMGGAESQIEANTNAILLEAANFHGANTRRMSREQKLRTEASLRFEKNIHPANALFGIRRAMRLIQSLADGVAARDLVDFYPRPQSPPPVKLTRKRIKYTLGVAWEDKRVSDTLTALGFKLKSAKDGEWDVEVPFWRVDVGIPEDLCEELSRIIGYKTIESAPLAAPLPSAAIARELTLPEQTVAAMEACVRYGLQEVINYAAVSREVDARCDGDGALDAVELVNPVSSERALMRRSLRGGLLKTAGYNLRMARDSVAIFECGHIYGATAADDIAESEAVGGVLAGARSRPHWRQKNDKYDFYDAKGCVESVLSKLNLTPVFTRVESDFFQPGRALAVAAPDGAPLGTLGELSSAVLDDFEIDARPVAFFELDLRALQLSAAKASAGARYQQIARVPQITRDLSLVVDQSVAAADLVEIIKRPPLIKSATVFDLYRGRGLPQGKKALAVRVVYQSPTKTLSSGKAAGVEQGILNALQTKFGARLRLDIANQG